MDHRDQQLDDYLEKGIRANVITTRNPFSSIFDAADDIEGVDGSRIEAKKQNERYAARDLELLEQKVAECRTENKMAEMIEIAADNPHHYS